jgi:hypothetical protein
MGEDLLTLLIQIYHQPLPKVIELLCIVYFGLPLAQVIIRDADVSFNGIFSKFPDAAQPGMDCHHQKILRGAL